MLNDALSKQLKWANSVDFDNAVDREIERLSLLFNAIVEHTQSVKHDAFFSARRESFREDDHVILNAPHLLNYYHDLDIGGLTPLKVSELFRYVAQDHRSLLISHMPLAPFQSVKREIGQITKYSDDDQNVAHMHTFFPPLEHFISKEYMGSIQIRREEQYAGLSYISFGILGLENHKLPSEMTALDEEIIKDLEYLYTATNHDWIHQFEKPVTNRCILAGQSTKIPLNQWVEGLPDHPRSESTSNNEFFCLQTHARLLNTESAKPLKKALYDRVEMLKDHLAQKAQHIESISNIGDKTDAYGHFYYYADLAIRALRRIEPINGPLIQGFMKDVLSMSPKGCFCVKQAMVAQWSSIGLNQHMDDLKSLTNYFELSHDMAKMHSDQYKQSKAVQNNPSHLAEMLGAVALQYDYKL